MNIKRHTIVSLFMTPLLLVLGSCDDFVDVQPINQINSDNFFNSEEDYQAALVGAYDLLQASYVNVMLAIMASDDALCGGESATDVPGFQEVDDMRHTVVNDQLRNVWNWMYAGINRCNYIFEFQDKTDFSGKSAILGQAAFLRAYYYFELLKFFGDVPMPLDKRVNFGEAENFPRTPAAQVYAQIEKDLTFAAANLPEVQVEKGRVTKGAAQALLGKVLVYQEKFSEAAPILDAVINSGVYQLESDYAGIFTLSGENNRESVFEVQYTNEQGAGFGCLQCSEGNVMVGFSGVRGYNGPVYRDGFSFCVLTPELAAAFDPADGRYRPTVFDIEAWATEQARQGVEVTWSEGYEHTGYFNQKYLPRKGETFQDPNLTHLNNYRAIRFSDVLLLAAEANNRGNLDQAKALSYLNRVRARASMPALNVSGAQLTDAIIHERRLELAGEGHRFFDLVRWGKAQEFISGFQTGKHELFPIPLEEIELAGNIWQNNPGY